MKYLAKCKKTLYYNGVSSKFSSSKKEALKTAQCTDLFGSSVSLVSKKEQIAVIEDFGEHKMKLHIMAGKSGSINSAIARQYFDLVYLDDICQDSKQKVYKKLGK